MHRFWWLFTGLALLLLTLSACSNLSGQSPKEEAESLNPKTFVRPEAPDFTLTLFDGDSLRLSDLRGQAVVLNFWAASCSPCRAEAADFEAVWRANQERGVVFVGVSVGVDGFQESPQEALDFIEEYGITFPNGHDEGLKIAQQAYGITNVPATVFIDATGHIYGTYPGALNEERLAGFVEELLAAGDATGS